MNKENKENNISIFFDELDLFSYEINTPLFRELVQKQLINLKTELLRIKSLEDGIVSSVQWSELFDDGSEDETITFSKKEILYFFTRSFELNRNELTISIDNSSKYKNNKCDEQYHQMTIKIYLDSKKITLLV